MKKLESTCFLVIAWPWHILSCLIEKEKNIKSYLAKGRYVRSCFQLYNCIEGASTSNASFHSKPIDGAL